MATYIPILGNFDAPFSLLDGVPSTVTRDVTAAYQGTPRPGVMRTVFQLTVDDGLLLGQASYVMQIPSPYVFTAALLASSLNSFLPIVNVAPIDPNGRLSLPIATYGLPGAWSEANQTIALGVLLTDPQDAVSNFLVTIDFSHTAIS